MSKLPEFLVNYNSDADRLENERMPAESRMVCVIAVSEKKEFLFKNPVCQEDCDGESYGLLAENILLGETPEKAFARYNKETLRLPLDEHFVRNAGEAPIDYLGRPVNMCILVCGLVSDCIKESDNDELNWCNLREDPLSLEVEQVLGELLKKERRGKAVFTARQAARQNNV